MVQFLMHEPENIPQQVGSTRLSETLSPPQIIKIIQGDLITQDVDAVVNAANESLLGGGGVDGLIHRAAGSELLTECRNLHGCPTGDAKITKGYRLKARHIIHTVGPVYPDNPDSDPVGCAKAEELLSRCYQNILRIARDNQLTTIAIPAISTGIFGYPVDKAAKVVHDTVVADLQQNGPGSIREIRFVLWEDEKFQTYQQAFAK